MTFEHRAAVKSYRLELPAFLVASLDTLLDSSFTSEISNDTWLSLSCASLGLLSVELEHYSSILGSVLRFDGYGGACVQCTVTYFATGLGEAA